MYLAAALLMCFSGAMAEKAFFFQPTNTPSNESRATFFFPATQGGDPSTMTSFGVSLWFNIQYFRENSYLFSYAISNERSNMLNFRVSPNAVSVALESRDFTKKDKEVYINTDRWYHAVVSVNQTEEIFEIYIDGERVRYGRVASKPIPLNGSLVLGQETDSFNGGFVAMQSFSGKITEFKIFGRTLREEEVKQLYACGTDSGPGQADILEWNPTDWELKGPVEQENVEVCGRKVLPYVVLRNQMFFEESRFLCNRLFRTDVYVPFSKEANDQLYEDAATFIPECKPDNHGVSFFFLGATDRGENGVWRDLEGNTLNFTNFRDSSTSSSQSCLAFNILPYRGTWNDVKCSMYAFCFACSEPPPTATLRLRGMCEESEIATMFRVGGFSDSRLRKIEGLSRYVINFNKTANHWLLYDMWRDQAIASHFDFEGSYPLGKKKWTLLRNYIVCNHPKDEEIELSLSTCNSFEFTCEDGSCVNLSKRCDLVADCPDKSDETKCEKLLVSKDYLKGLPPGGVSGEPLNINMSLVVEKLSEIDVLNMRLRIDFVMKMRWFDSRLTYINLNNMAEINIVSPDDVWTPDLEFVNADFPSIKMMEPQLTVHRESEPNEDDLSRPLRDDHFAGGKNPIVLQRRISSSFDCLMDLSNYPFDSQTCNVKMKLKSVTRSLAKWGDVDVLYIGEKKLSEYEIGRTYSKITEDDEHSVARIAIELNRRYTYHVTTVYIPVLMLLMISYVSFFIRLEDNDLRIMMTITTLLVLYSLYQQISDGLPKTSYAKAVDIWCFFALTIIFTQVVFHVMIDAQFTFFKRKFGSDSKLQNTVSVSCSSRQRVYWWSRSLYMLFMVLFIIGYVVYICINTSS